VSWKLEQIERITSAKTTRSFPPNESAIFSLEFGNPRFGRRGTFGNRWAVARHAPPARRRPPEPCAIGPARKGFLKRSGDTVSGYHHPIGQEIGNFRGKPLLDYLGIHLLETAADVSPL